MSRFCNSLGFGNRPVFPSSFGNAGFVSVFELHKGSVVVKPAVPDASASCPLPEDEQLSVEGTAAVGATIQYQCAAGSMLVGTSENACQENQTWRYPHPICQPPLTVQDTL
ncbi:hypothetical protein NFI96_007860 [Prochilodus magdalenae]|nr:hypothetical protein NFI96_007860 [Prochilodus magdalenae]